MTTRERILRIRLAEKIRDNPKYGEKIGISVNMADSDRTEMINTKEGGGNRI